MTTTTEIPTGDVIARRIAAAKRENDLAIQSDYWQAVAAVESGQLDVSQPHVLARVAVLWDAMGKDAAAFDRDRAHFRQRKADAKLLAALPDWQSKLESVNKKREAHVAALNEFMAKATADALAMDEEVNAITRQINIADAAKNRLFNSHLNPILRADESRLTARLLELRSEIEEAEERMKAQITVPLATASRELRDALERRKRLQGSSIDARDVSVVARLEASVKALEERRAERSEEIESLRAESDLVTLDLQKLAEQHYEVI